jgi:hypothetical protein
MDLLSTSVMRQSQARRIILNATTGIRNRRESSVGFGHSGTHKRQMRVQTAKQGLISREQWLSPALKLLFTDSKERDHEVD